MDVFTVNNIVWASLAIFFGVVFANLFLNFGPNSKQQDHAHVKEADAKQVQKLQAQTPYTSAYPSSDFCGNIAISKQIQQIPPPKKPTKPQYLKLSIAEGQDDPAGFAHIELTLADHIGQMRKINKTLKVPNHITFPLRPEDTVTQVDVRTPDGHQHRLRYPKMNETLVLQSYYSDWFGQSNSSWQSDWSPDCSGGIAGQHGLVFRH